MDGERWRAADAVHRASEVVRHEGPRALWFRSIGELGYRRLLIFARATAPAPVPRAAPDGFEIGWADRDRVRAEPLLRRRLGGDELERRLAAGDRCVMIRDGDGALLHSCWVAQGSMPFPYLGLSVLPAPATALTYDAFTEPAARGRRLSEWRSLWTLAQLAEEGTGRVVSAALPENRAALRPPARVGFRPIGILGRVRLAGRVRIVSRLPAGVFAAIRPSAGGVEDPEAGLLGEDAPSIADHELR